MVREVVKRQGRGVTPLEEVFGARSEGADAGTVAVRRDDELVGPEQLLVALGHAHATLVGVAAQLLDALGHRVGDVRALALDDDERDAVDEQHDVRRDVLLRLPARLIHPELVDRQEVVVLGVIEVDEPDALAAPLIPVRQAGHGHALQQPLSDDLVDLDEATDVDALERRDCFGEAGVVEPGRTIRPRIDLGECCAKSTLQERSSERLTLRDVGSDLDPSRSPTRPAS